MSASSVSSARLCSEGVQQGSAAIGQIGPLGRIGRATKAKKSKKATQWLSYMSYKSQMSYKTRWPHKNPVAPQPTESRREEDYENFAENSIFGRCGAAFGQCRTACRYQLRLAYRPLCGGVETLHRGSLGSDNPRRYGTFTTTCRACVGRRFAPYTVDSSSGSYCSNTPRTVAPLREGPA